MKNSRWRTILVLSGTLIIGFVLGMLTSVQIRNAQIRKFRSFASQEGFGRWTLHVVDPSPEQKEKIMPVIKKYGRKNLELRKKYRKDFIGLMKDYKKELYPLLTPEQIQRLETRSHSNSHRYKTEGTRGRRPGNGPPAGKPGENRGETPCPYFY